jgi:chromosome segregation ATPase
MFGYWKKKAALLESELKHANAKFSELVTSRNDWRASAEALSARNESTTEELQEAKSALAILRNKVAKQEIAIRAARQALDPAGDSQC